MFIAPLRPRRELLPTDDGMSDDGMSDDGMSTVEYAIGLLAAAAFAALLAVVINSDGVLAGLTSLIERAFAVT